MKQHEAKRSSFSGRIGFVLSAAGASVGLGNIWRFPYLAAKYGGGIFLLIYILLTASFGYVLRNFPCNIYYSGIDVWLYNDNSGDSIGANDTEKSCGSVRLLRQVKIG